MSKKIWELSYEEIRDAYPIENMEIRTDISDLYKELFTYWFVKMGNAMTGDNPEENTSHLATAFINLIVASWLWDKNTGVHLKPDIAAHIMFAHFKVNKRAVYTLFMAAFDQMNGYNLLNPEPYLEEYFNSAMR